MMEWLDGLDRPVLVSNATTERVVELYQRYGYTAQYLDAPRRISCNGDRTTARED
jgi:DNA adenine methylase